MDTYATEPWDSPASAPAPRYRAIQVWCIIFSLQPLSLPPHHQLPPHLSSSAVAGFRPPNNIIHRRRLQPTTFVFCITPSNHPSSIFSLLLLTSAESRNDKSSVSTNWLRPSRALTQSAQPSILLSVPIRRCAALVTTHHSSAFGHSISPTVLSLLTNLISPSFLSLGSPFLIFHSSGCCLSSNSSACSSASDAPPLSACL